MHCDTQTTFCECRASNHPPKPSAKQPGTPLCDLTPALLSLSLAFQTREPHQEECGHPSELPTRSLEREG